MVLCIFLSAVVDFRLNATWHLNLPLLLLWGSCQGKLYCSHDISKLQTIKFPPDKEKSVTLEKFIFLRETVNKSSFSRAKVCSVTTAIFLRLGTDGLYCVTKGINPLCTFAVLVEVPTFCL